MRRGALLLPLVVVSAGLACNGINGVNDLQLVECAGPTCQSPQNLEDAGDIIVDRPRDSGTPTQDSGPVILDATSEDTGPPGKPTYCAGTTFYLAYDNTTNTTIPAATPPAATSGNVTFEAGKFKQAARFDNQMHYYANTGNTLLNPPLGSFAVWVKPLFDLTNEPRRYFLRPRNAANTGNGGPAITIQNQRVMMQVVDDGSPTATIDPTQAAAQWTTTQFMLMVGTWDKSAPAGTPSLSITLYTPTGKLEATYTGGPWNPEANNAAYFRIGNNASAVFDEVTVWNRILTKGDMDQLAAATKPLDEACQ